jgi:hypothetical protein
MNRHGGIRPFSYYENGLTLDLANSSITGHMKVEIVVKILYIPSRQDYYRPPSTPLGPIRTSNLVSASATESIVR